MDSQESAALAKSTNDSTCHSNFVNKLPNNVVQSNEVFLIFFVVFPKSSLPSGNPCGLVKGQRESWP